MLLRNGLRAAGCFGEKHSTRGAALRSRRPTPRSLRRRPQVPRRPHVLRHDAPPGENPIDWVPWLGAAARLKLWQPAAAVVPAAAAAALLLLAAPPQLGQQLAPAGTGGEEAHAAAVGTHQAEQGRLSGSSPAPPVAAVPGSAAGAEPSGRGQARGHEADGSARPFVLDGPTSCALAVSMVVAALANSAGVGGGAFIVPLMYLGLGFGIKDSTALSQAVIAGGALGSVVCCVAQPHPLDRCRPLIDYRLALIITPPLLLGCTTGVLFNQLLPSWGVTLLLIPLLCHLTHRTACTAARLHRAEASMATLDRWLSVEELQQLQAAQERLRAEAEAERAAAAARVPQGCPPPWLHGLELLALWGLVLGFQLGKQAFDRCSWQFGALYGGQAAATLAASAFFIWQVVREREHGCGCGEHGAVPPPGAPQGGAARLYGPTGGDSSSWEPQRLVSSAGVALAGGTVAGMLGIGGGMIVGPLMLELGIHPQVSSATASAMVLFSASSAAASFALEGRLNTEHAAVFGVACAVAAYVGVELVGRAVRASGKSSLVVMLLAGLIGAGALLTTLFSGADAVADLLSGRAAGMGSFCGPR